MYLCMYLWIDAVFTKFIINFEERRYEINTSRLFHCKDNRLNCVAEYVSCSRSHQNVLRHSHKVKTFFNST